MGIININTDRAARPSSRRAQSDESDDAICRLPFSSRARDKLNGSTFPGFGPEERIREKGNWAPYRLSAATGLLTGENWLGILVKTKSNPDAPWCSREEVLRYSRVNVVRDTPEVPAKTFMDSAAIMAVLLSGWRRVRCEQLTVDE